MTALVECRHVSVGREGPVLENVNFAVEPGEIVALLGPSGSGKSTLLRAMTGLLQPLAGEVQLFGEPLYDSPPDVRESLLRRTGMAFQQDALFGAMTVADNVALPLRELGILPDPVIDEMVRIKLALVGLGGMENRAPASLSGGERKRAALARAMVLDPEVVFCDEPSAGLDPVVAAGIDETLLRLRQVFGTAIVLVSHELVSLRAIADRAIMFANGTVWAAGTIDELANSPDVEVYNFFHRIPAKLDHIRARGVT